MRRHLLVLAALLALSTARGFAAPQPPPPPEMPLQSETTAQSALLEVLTSTEIEGAWFTVAFLRALPVDKLQQEVDTMRARLGSFISLRLTGNHYELRFTHGRAKATIILAGTKIDELRFYDQIDKATEDGLFRLNQIFAAQEIPSVIFAPEFLRQYTLADVRAWVKFLEDKYGPYRSSDIVGQDTFVVQFERGASGAQLHLDENEKVDGLSFSPLAEIKPGGS